MDILIPILVLLAVCAIAAIGYRVVTGSTRNSSDAGLPKAEPDSSRPLGDTAEAHDEINPHDLPKDNPGRPAAEQMVQGDGGTTVGHDEGGAAGEGGPGDTDRVGADEAGRGARP